MKLTAGKRRECSVLVTTMAMLLAACTSGSSEADEATTQTTFRDGSPQERALVAGLVGVSLEDVRQRAESEGFEIGLIDRVGLVATADALVTEVILAADGSIDLVVGPMPLDAEEESTTCRSIKSGSADESFILAWTSVGIVGLATGGDTIASLADDADDWLIGGGGPMDVTVSSEGEVSIKHPGRTWTIAAEAETQPVAFVGLIGEERPVVVRVGNGETGFATSIFGYEPDGSVAWKIELESPEVLIPVELVSTPEGFVVSLSTESGTESNWMGFDRDGELLWSAGHETGFDGAASTSAGAVVLAASGQLQSEADGRVLAAGPFAEIVTSSWNYVLLRSRDGVLTSFDVLESTTTVLNGLEGCSIAAPRSVKVGT